MTFSHFPHLLHLSNRAESYSGSQPQDPVCLHSHALALEPSLEWRSCVRGVLPCSTFAGICPPRQAGIYRVLVSSIFHCCFFPNSLLAGFVFSISMATNPVCRKSHLAFIEGTCNYFQSQVLSRSLTFSVP